MYCEPAEENHDIDMSYCAWPSGGCVHQYLLYVKAKNIRKYTSRSTSPQPPVPQQHQFHQQQLQQKYQPPYFLLHHVYIMYSGLSTLRI